MEVIAQKLSKTSILVKNGQILAKNGQILVISGFSRHKEYNFLEGEHIRTTFTQKLEGFIVEFRSYGPKTFQSVNFGQKWPISGHKWPNFGHFRIFPAFRVWFSQRRPYAQLPYKKLGGFIAAFGSYRSKTLKNVNFGQKWPNFGHKWPNFGHLRIFPA